MKKKMDKAKLKGFTLVEVMIIITIIALLTAIAIPNVLKMRITANDVTAQATLKTISGALENFFIVHGLYPSVEDELFSVTPPYLSKNYFSGEYAGFTYDSELSSIEYTVTATPTSIGKSGTTLFVINTGGVFSNN
ncbi:MAG TPA: prepilin-type N-terminal cleavage/methylation domain-containing protein [Candidatus Omnitrophota bacterium]|nr:prepilin-type N-terminal cleavage/methylation domain-containing protein [Candidatus Omnitrophota bacterium]HPD85160.1 prepilin-type N-terminal cleavage/methylation domain-containing protein [Candidatus Omnitrophota bacterium]HRZ04339.1 prepilin-type N-terminal cleavage/methylation domain-containing protein [Candidatus Omnitrophota bacterium]